MTRRGKRVTAEHLDPALPRPGHPGHPPFDSADAMSVELSSRRTGMSFQRTRLSAERTLMSVIRTSLSLIGFGFTIYQVFRKLYESGIVQIGVQAPRTFGVALVALGIGVLALGIAYHLHFMKTLRAERQRMIVEGLVHGESAYPVSYTLLTAGALLLLGLLAIVSMVFDVAPFG